MRRQGRTSSRTGEDKPRTFHAHAPGQRELTTIANMILSELAPLVSAQHGAFYAMSSPSDEGEQVLELQAGYGLEERKHLPTSFRLGEGLVGQCAKEKKRILVTEVPDDW